MSFYEESSIIITPNAYKAGTLYAVVPTSGLADMDVTRATAATRVDENGLINYAEALGSELVTNGDFATDSAWSKVNATISGGTGNLDGTGVTSMLYQGILTNSSTYTATFTISNYNGIGQSSIINNAGGVLYEIVSDGTFTFTFTHSISNSNFIFRAISSAIYSIDNVSVKEVIKDNVPRIDYTGGGCPHILAEPQRTNVITYSEDFSQSVWTKSGASVTSGFISPDGTTNAYKLVEDTSNGAHRVGRGIPTSAVDYSFSVFAKIGERSNIALSSSYGVDGIFDLSNGTVYSGSSANIVLIGNGWYKCSVVRTATVAAPNFNINLVDDSYNLSYTGDGTSGVYIWGAQFEAGSYPTSYIPTSGSTVTRNQDVFTRDGISSLINSEEGTLFVEMAALSELTDSRVISINNGTSSYYIWLNYTSASNTIRYVYGFLGTNYADLPTVVADTTLYSKIAVTWKLNEFKFFINGTKISEDLSGSVMPAGTLNKLEFNRANGSEKMNGKIKQLQVYKTALSDSELTILTTP